MNILFLTQVLPYPLDAGPKVRAYYVLRHLAREHNVTLVSFTRPSDRPAAVAHLREFCHDVHCLPMPRSKLRDAFHLARSLVSGKSFIIERDWVAAMTQLLEKVVADQGPFQAVHADQLWMASYALWVRALVSQRQPASQPPLLVLDQHNAVYMIPQRMAQHTRNWFKRTLLRLEARALARYEVETCLKFDRVTWVTREDYAALHQQAADLPCTAVIPICIDPESGCVPPRPAGARRVTFMGGLHYPPNAEGILWFAREVFPQVLRTIPDALLTVIGKDPPAQLQHCGIPHHNLDVTGYVADPTPLLQETAAWIVPLHSGGGMRVKILDGWKYAIPIVSTQVGAEGIEACAERNMLLADTPADFATATVRLLENPTFAQQLALGGREQAMSAYNWRSRYKEWDAIYSS